MIFHYSRLDKIIGCALIGSFIVLLSLPLLLFQGIVDYSLALPNGYRLIRTSASIFTIAGPDNSIVIEPKIDKYGVNGKFVIGKASYCEDDPDSVAGYFVVDTSSGLIQKGLNEEELLNMLGANKMQRIRLERPPRTIINVIVRGQGHRLR